MTDTIASLAGMPQHGFVAVLDITAIADDGTGIASFTEMRSASKSTVRVLADAQKPIATGDRVLARLNAVAPNQYEARVIREISRHRHRLFGVVISRGQGFILESADKKVRIPYNLLAPEKTIPFAAGDLVEAEIIRASAFIGKSARVIHNLGSANSAGSYSALAIAEFDMRHIFSDACLTEAETAPPPSLEGRRDLRDLPLVTIDGVDARDFDDAVLAIPDGTGGYRIIVAIADVAHFVKEDSALDREAALRGNSVYFPDCVIPMLPEALSNDLCSLIPLEDRLCLAVEFSINAQGQKTEHRFFRGLMRSAARLNYDEVEAYRQDGRPIQGIDAEVIDNLLGAYSCLKKARLKRGALDLDLPEKKVRFDGSTPVAIDKIYQSVSQKMIEEIMILANVAAAQTLEKAGVLCVFRTHAAPAYNKIDALGSLANSMGLPFPRGQVITPNHFNALLVSAAERTDAANFALLNETVLRCQAQADYRTTIPPNADFGHFGLALKRYAHFTSPIRRYADLLVHRQIISVLEKRPSSLDHARATEIAIAISDSERKAIAAERRTIDRFATHLLESHIGRITQGRIIGIARMGAFVDIGDSGAEGFLHLSQLGDDYYEADPARGVIRGRRSRQEFRIGQTLSVMIAETSSIKASIELKLAQGNMPIQRRPKSRTFRRRRPY